MKGGREMINSHALYQYQEGFAIEKKESSCARVLLAFLLPRSCFLFDPFLFAV